MARGGGAVRVGICRHKKMLGSLSHGSLTLKEHEVGEENCFKKAKQ